MCEMRASARRRSVTSSKVETHPPAAIGRVAMAKVRPSASSRYRVADAAPGSSSARVLPQMSSVEGPAAYRPSAAMRSTTSRWVWPGRTASGDSPNSSRKRSLWTTRRASASNMQRPWDMFASAASNRSFWASRAASVRSRSVTSSWVPTQPPPGIGSVWMAMVRPSASSTSASDASGAATTASAQRR